MCLCVNKPVYLCVNKFVYLCVNTPVCLLCVNKSVLLATCITTNMQCMLCKIMVCMVYIDYWNKSVRANVCVHCTGRRMRHVTTIANHMTHMIQQPLHLIRTTLWDGTTHHFPPPI